jgi:hypothetical protein
MMAVRSLVLLGALLLAVAPASALASAKASALAASARRVPSLPPAFARALAGGLVALALSAAPLPSLADGQAEDFKVIP